MSRLSNHFAEVARPALLEHLGETVTHYPLGVVASAASVTALVDLAGDAQVDSDGEGERLIRRGRLEISAAVTVTYSERHNQRDSFLVRTQLWQAVGTGGTDGAIKTVLIERREPIATKAGRTK